MQLKKIYLIFFVGFSLNGCMDKVYTKQESAFILFKTPTFKYADLGFIYTNNDEMKIEIYGSGEAIMALEISKDSVCMSLLTCMDKQQFNTKVLSATYPVDILDTIFRGKKIFDGKGLKKLRNGFTQSIRNSNKYEIHYSVLNKQILFHDTINDIKIKIKRMDG
ncbi:MAG: hypothetical protein DSZ08_05165 [Sulfurovum sp.]|nr:MAG: hypothetical protein DSZ08_05165 [Sulfurovum sp.]